ncbi:MAG: hypothetical protein ACOCXA_07855 [Planctomycetota bacterium]
MLIVMAALVPVTALEQVEVHKDASATIAAARQTQSYTLIYVQRGAEEARGDLWNAYNAALAHEQFPSQVATTRLDLDDGDQQALIDDLDLGQIDTPIVVLVAPNGAITWGDPQAVDVDAVRSSLLPATDQAIIRAFQQQQGALICIETGDAKQDANARSGVDAAMALDVVSEAVDKITVEPGMAGRDALLKALRLPAEPDQPITMLLVPPGRIAGQIKGPTERDAVLGLILQAMNSGGGCCP